MTKLQNKTPKEKYGIKLTATINNSPLPVLIEYPDGRENPIIKAYFVTGRTAAIKILIDDYNDEGGSKDDRIQELEEEVNILESEIHDLAGYKDKLEEWTDTFDGDAETTKNLWDAIEESVSQFADSAGLVCLEVDDSKNIDKLHNLYNQSVSDLKDADEIIGELKLENLAAKRKIAELEERACGLGGK